MNSHLPTCYLLASYRVYPNHCLSDHCLHSQLPICVPISCFLRSQQHSTMSSSIPIPSSRNKQPAHAHARNSSTSASSYSYHATPGSSYASSAAYSPSSFNASPASLGKGKGKEREVVQPRRASLLGMHTCLLAVVAVSYIMGRDRKSGMLTRARVVQAAR